MEHKLKILPQYFKAVQNGNKTFEIRKNDRDFKVGDTLLLQEYILPFTQPLGVKEGYYTGQEITKEISYFFEGKGYGLKEGYCILGLKQEGIQLRNIDLTGISKFEQAGKVNEEMKEFFEAFKEYIENKTEDNKNHVIEELWDEIQSKLGLLEKYGISAEEVMKSYPKHLEKIKNRPR